MNFSVFGRAFDSELMGETIYNNLYLRIAGERDITINPEGLRELIGHLTDALFEITMKELTEFASGNPHFHEVRRVGNKIHIEYNKCCEYDELPREVNGIEVVSSVDYRYRNKTDEQ